jgi:hypothetical protein
MALGAPTGETFVEQSAAGLAQLPLSLADPNVLMGLRPR